MNYLLSPKYLRKNKIKVGQISNTKLYISFAIFNQFKVAQPTLGYLQYEL